MCIRDRTTAVPIVPVEIVNQSARQQAGQAEPGNVRCGIESLVNRRIRRIKRARIAHMLPATLGAEQRVISTVSGRQLGLRELRIDPLNLQGPVVQQGYLDGCPQGDWNMPHGCLLYTS